MEATNLAGVTNGLPRGQQVAAAQPSSAGTDLLPWLIGLVGLACYLGAQAANGADSGVTSLLLFVGVTIAALSAWWTAGQLRAADRRTWLALAAGLTLWALAASYALPWVHQFRPADAPDRTLLFCLANGVWIYALFSLRHSTTLVPQVTRILDAALVVCCGGTLLGYFILDPAQPIPNTPLLLIHATSSVLLFGVLVAYRYLAAGPLPTGPVLVLGSLIAALVGDSRQLWLEAGTATPLEPLLSVAPLVMALLFVLAGRHTVRPAGPGHARNLWDRAAHWLSLVFLSGVMALAVAGYLLRPLNQMLFFGVLACLALGVLRLGFSLGENQQLRDEHARLRGENEEYIRLAISDPLTGMFNRGYFEFRLKTELERSRRDELPLTLVSLDLDYFKQVNDRFGHAAGDALLKEVGHALRATSRSADIPCRCGGDEFIVILPHTTAELATIAADRYRNAIKQVLKRHSLHALVSVSAGIASYPQMAQTAEDLTRLADQALYQSKQNGKDRVTIFAR